MSTLNAKWDLDEIEMAETTTAAALRVVERMSRQRDDIESQWATVIRLAHANGASLRDIAEVAGVAPQTVSRICKG